MANNLISVLAVCSFFLTLLSETLSLFRMALKVILKVMYSMRLRVKSNSPSPPPPWFSTYPCIPAPQPLTQATSFIPPSCCFSLAFNTAFLRNIQILLFLVCILFIDFSGSFLKLLSYHMPSHIPAHCLPPSPCSGISYRGGGAVFRVGLHVTLLMLFTSGGCGILSVYFFPHFSCHRV